mgnify:CR=1 FL=1
MTRKRVRAVRQWWVVMALREVVQPAEVIGFLPVYDSEAKARAHAGDKYHVGLIAEIASPIPTKRRKRRG